MVTGRNWNRTGLTENSKQTGLKGSWTNGSNLGKGVPSGSHQRQTLIWGPLNTYVEHTLIPLTPFSPSFRILGLVLVYQLLYKSIPCSILVLPTTHGLSELHDPFFLRSTYTTVPGVKSCWVPPYIPCLFLLPLSFLRHRYLHGILPLYPFMSFPT